jgi:hypothetical protein
MEARRGWSAPRAAAGQPPQPPKPWREAANARPARSTHRALDSGTCAVDCFVQSWALGRASRVPSPRHIVALIHEISVRRPHGGERFTDWIGTSVREGAAMICPTSMAERVQMRDFSRLHQVDVRRQRDGRRASSIISDASTPRDAIRCFDRQRAAATGSRRATPTMESASSACGGSKAVHRGGGEQKITPARMASVWRWSGASRSLCLLTFDLLPEDLIVSLVSSRIHPPLLQSFQPPASLLLHFQSQPLACRSARELRWSPQRQPANRMAALTSELPPPPLQHPPPRALASHSSRPLPLPVHPLSNLRLQ